MIFKIVQVSIKLGKWCGVTTLILMLQLFQQLACGSIITTDSIEIIKSELNSADENTLVIFDCDDVLIHKTDVVFKPENKRFLKKCIAKMLSTNPGLVSRMGELKGIIFKTLSQIVVDKNLLEIINNIQSKGIKTLVITAMKNEKLGETDSIEIRKEELKRFGFDFSKSWNYLEKSFLGEAQKSPYYEAGVVCSKPGSKGNALKLFMQYSKFIPNKVICVDDRIENLINIREFLNPASIKLAGIEYTAAKEILDKLPLSEERLMFQLNYLKLHNVWLSDEEAEKRMKKD
ncbi:MAG: DUF2608 domain-containing protein [Holosporales bacterium]|jgi:hypothetical protein|nr:DUF2608 domain-containing protein [Holosporales bacterium]